MILTEDQLKKVVCNQLRIMCGRAHKFEGFFKFWRCQSSYKEFTYGEFYLSWVGCVEQYGIKNCFVCHTDAKEAIIVPPEVIGNFRNAKEERKVFVDQHYRIITGSDNKQRLAPQWWFDCVQVKKSGNFPKEFRKARGKFELVGIGKKTFIAWSFYCGEKLYKVFNMEDGVWFDASEITSQISIGKEGYVLGKLHLCCVNQIVDKAMKRNIYK